MKTQLTLILCTHNPRMDYLQRTLESLRAQDLPTQHWEFLLIDNGSHEPLSTKIDLSWHPHGRVIREDTLGLTPARLRGISESTGPLLVFVDDDNELAPNYLTQALALAETNPQLGAFGGSVTGVFETPPPAWSKAYLCYLAIREVTRSVWTNEFRYDVVPVGAGMCLRRTLALAYAQNLASSSARTQLDRKGTSLASGGDSDMAFTALDQGLGIGLFPQLSLKHLIPSGRLQLAYLEKLSYSIAYSSVLLLHLRGLPVPKPPTQGRLVRWVANYQLWRQPSEVRQLEKAIAKGRSQALQEIQACAHP